MFPSNNGVLSLDKMLATNNGHLSVIVSSMAFIAIFSTLFENIFSTKLIYDS